MSHTIPPYSGYIFDLDGTLINSSADIAGALNRARREVGLKELPTSSVLPMIGNGLPKLVERGFKDFHELTHEELVELTRRCYLTDPCSNTVVYPGVFDVLEHLCHKPLAIISNKPSELMMPTLEALDLKPYFNIVIGGEDFPDKKPHPASALHVLSQWELDSSEVLMVGDMEPDQQLALNAGLPYAHCLYGFLDTPLEAKHLLHSIGDLLP